MQLSFKHIRIISVTGFIVLNLGLFIWWGVIVNYNQKLDNALATEYYKLKLQGAHIDTKLEKIIDLFNNKADPITYNYYHSAISDDILVRELLHKILLKSDLVHSCSVLDIQGNTLLGLDRELVDNEGNYLTIQEGIGHYHNHHIEFNISDPEIQIPLHNRIYISPAKRLDKLEKSLIHVAVPLNVKDSVIGILYGEIELNAFWKLHEYIKYDYTTLFLDSRGTLISSIENGKLLKEYGEVKTNIPIVRQLIAKAGTSSIISDQVYVNNKGKDVYLVGVRMDKLNLMLVTEIPTYIILIPIYKQLAKFSVLFLLSLILILLFFNYIFKSLNFSISSLTNVFKLSAKGEYLLSTIDNPITELKKVHLGYNAMVENIKSRELELEKKNKDIAIQNQQLVEANLLNQKLSTAVNQTENTIVITDLDGNIEYTNPAFTKVTGYTAAEVLGKNTRILNSKKLPKSFFIDLWDTLLFGKTWRGELRNITKHGELYWERATITPIKNDDGLIINYLAVKENISDKKIAEQKIKDSNEQLKKLNTELDRFVYSASHDLRAPLASLLGLLDLSKRENLSPTLEQYLQLMNKSIIKLDSFISDITDYSRNLRLEAEIDKINCKEFITDIYNTLVFMSDEKIDFSLNCNEGAIIYSDPGRLNLVIGNLISNSIRYRSPRRPLKLEVDVINNVESGFTITIKDNGQGISKEHQSKVFDMFYRATDQKTGSGLGLFIVNETVDKLKGTIDLKSEINIGTVITLDIPYSTPSNLN